MRSIDQFQFYRLGHFIHPLAEFTGEEKLREVWVDIWVAGSWLDFLLSGQLVDVTVSRDAVRALIATIRRVVPIRGAPDNDDLEKTLNGLNMTWALRNGVETFETVLGAELHVMPSYIVKQKGIYHTDDLIERAERAFDSATLKVLPDGAVKDFREAGRCLAFELPTAAGYHVMRCTEAVLRRYHRTIKNLPDDDKSPDWAVCINEIKKAGGNPKVTVILDQIRDLHRNPVSHPDEFLDTSQALSLFDVAKSAIAAMAAEIIKIEASVPTTPILPALTSIGELAAAPAEEVETTT